MNYCVNVRQFERRWSCVSVFSSIDGLHSGFYTDLLRLAMDLQFHLRIRQRRELVSIRFSLCKAEGTVVSVTLYLLDLPFELCRIEVIVDWWSFKREHR